MSWRIKINWEVISPLLKFATGVVTVERFKQMDAMDPPYEVHSFNIRVENNTFGLKGLIPDFKERYRDIIKSMANCFLEGVCLDNSSHHWIEDYDIIERDDIDYMI